MAKLPLMIEMHAQPCLVVGGGVVAARKVTRLLDCGAQVTVVAPVAQSRVREWAAQKCITWLATAFDETHLDGMRLIIAATDDERLNQRVAHLAEARGILINVVDDAQHSRVYFPAILRRGLLTIAISSEGNSPTLARVVRSYIAARLPPQLGAWSQTFSDVRKRLKSAISDGAVRQRVWQTLLAKIGFMATTISEKMIADAEWLARQKVGQVYLVGAGPGDPQLLTLRAWTLLQQADVIVYDRLVSDDILAMARGDAELIYVGKACAAHSMPQHDINQLLIDLARRGLTVLRLKGGDPFVFGRGGEEMHALREENIPVAIVPGITAALGCAASAQIPLTLRGVANRVQFLTAHSADDGLPELDWHSLNSHDLTLVFYMGLKNVAALCEQLIAHGRAPETPAAIICAGTSAAQKNIYARLVDLPLQVHEACSPSLIVVGDVVTWAAEYSAHRHTESLSAMPVLAPA